MLIDMIIVIMHRLIFKQFRQFCSSIEIVQAENKKISKFQLKNFSDSVKLSIRAGKGGNGVMTYYTDKRVRNGAPDGGDGGKGGSIIVQAHRAMHDLSHLRLKNIEGVDGKNGGARGMQGKDGGKTLIRVPCGTLIYQIKIDEEKETKNFLADLDRDKEEILVAQGGSAGKGNKLHPLMREQDKIGHEGQRKIIYLELKTLADIGLVGFPNIGKSTFLAATTRAMPKIANYEFTTLKPSVGHVKFVDEYFMTVADIPGIIEDAHQNKGLGFEFLRHIERTKILVFMLDITQKDPLEQYRILEKELFQFKNNVFKDRKRIVVFNKKDCMPNSEVKFKIFSEKISAKSFLISAKQGDGVGEVLVELRRIKEQIDKKLAEELELKRILQSNNERAKV